MQNPKISIVLSDRNWILERLGKELQSRIENIDLNDAGDPSADINYYITFACRKQPMPTLEMGFFTHMEQTPELQSLFFQTAREIDLPVAMSKLYLDMLHEAGITNAIAIAPGVDLERFEPKLRIGVVGRAYHTGRKGEGLIAQLMDMEGIDWHFTGTGWPQPGKFIPDADLPDFYRSMDFILVPALYEGGPMCVPEALAVGTPVIASDVGWVPEFPHIPFKNGDAGDLRRVLSEQLEIKKQLRASTESYTWDNYAAAHDRAFHDLMKRADKSGKARKAQPAAPFSQPVRLLLHGDESKTLGGPSVRVPRTAEALRDLGVPASAATFGRADGISEDIVHLFNVWNPHSALQAMHRLKAAGKTVVFSPIYLDLSERDFWHFQLPELAVDDPESLRQGYADARMHQKGRGRLPEAVPGYNAMVREMLGLADHVIFLSEAERKALAEIGAVVEDDRASLVRNPVDPGLWQDADPEIFRDAYLDDLPGPQDYVICIGRIEPRKNQLMLARAIRDLPIRLVLVGHEGDPAYAEKIRQVGGDRVLMTGRLEHGGEMLRSALAGARVFALPSWSEGASLAALEAAAAGANMVLSDRSSEHEYFGDLAQYCDPGDADSIRQALEAAMAVEDPATRGDTLRALVADNNSWERYAEDTGKAYARAKATPARPLPADAAKAPRHSPRLVLDITTLAHHQGRITGISRVESTLAQALLDGEADPIFICWNDSIRRFVEVPGRFARLQNASRYRARFDNRFDTAPVELPADCTVVVPGSAWMQNTRYVRGLEDLKQRAGCSMISVVYDLVPFKFPFWFDRTYAPVFRDNFFRLAMISDQILTDSQSCADDVTEVMAAAGQVCPPVTPIRLGDPVLTRSDEDGAELAPESVLQRFAGQKFVLAVGAIHARKNYDMLYRVWARMADEGKNRDLHLVIVGGVAWNGQPLAERIAADTRVNRNIHILSGIGDEDLAWLYANCLFTAFPSHYEGWGLPVAESLVHGKLCLATSASSVPEIAPQFVEHIDPEDFATWHNKISFYASSQSARSAKEDAIREGYQQVSWDRTAEQILDTVQQPRVIRGLNGLYPGEIADGGNRGRSLQIGFDAGWHAAESWGRWAAAERAVVTLDTSRALRPGQSHLRLHVKQKINKADDSFHYLTLRAGGQVLFTGWVNRRSFIRDLILTVPAEAVGADGLLKLEWTHPTSAEKPGQSGPQRNLGIGLISVSLLDVDYSNPLQSLPHTQNWIDGNSPAQVDFANENHRDVTASCLNFNPAWGVGSQDGSFDLLVPVVPGAPDQDLVLTCRPIACAGTAVTASFRWNGETLAEETWTSDAPVHIRLPLAAGLLARSGPSVLSVETDSLLTPSDLDIGPSRDVAGLGVMGLTLTPKEA